MDNPEVPLSPEETPQPLPPAPPTVSLKPMYMTLMLLFGVLLGAGGLFAYQEYAAQRSVTSVVSYDECITAPGSRIQESYPATCITSDNKRFTQPIPDTDITVPPSNNEPLSCSSDDDCTTGIQTNGCCMCPAAIHKSEIGNNDWETYVKGKDYSNKFTCKTLVACKPCQLGSKPVCRKTQCVFEDDKP